MFKLKMIATGIAAVLAVSASAGYVATALAADAPPAAVGPATAPSVAATTQPTTAPGPAAAPKDTVIDAITAAQAGNADVLIACFDHPTDQETKTLTTVARVMGAASDLRKAVADKFGPHGGDKVIVVFGGQALLNHAFDNVPVNITGDKADVGEGDGAYHMLKVGDVWKIIPDRTRFAQIHDVFGNFDSALDAIKSLTADVKAGKYASADDVHDALMDIIKPPAEKGL